MTAARENSRSQSTPDRRTAGGHDAYLEAAIEAHPELWREMRAAYERGKTSKQAGWVLTGMVQALCIVGGFSTDLVIDRLAS